MTKQNEPDAHPRNDDIAGTPDDAPAQGHDSQADVTLHSAEDDEEAPWCIGAMSP